MIEILLTFISGILIYFGQSDESFDFLIQKNLIPIGINVEKIQFWFTIIGLLWSGLILPFKYFSLNKKYKKLELLYKGLIHFHKISLIDTIKSKLKLQNIELNTRIFKPKNDVYSNLLNLFLKKTVLQLHKVDGVTDDFHHKTLKFEVNKSRVEGMVGKSYKNRALCVDFNLDENNEYDLSEEQKLKIGPLSFCSTIPIFDENQSKINAILSIDSNSEILFNDTEKKDWEQHMVYYAAFIDKHTNL